MKYAKLLALTLLLACGCQHTNGDLAIAMNCDCGVLAMPIVSHQTYIAPVAYAPTKQNGYEAMGSLASRIESAGEQSLSVGNHTYSSARLVRTDSIIAASGTGPGVTDTTTHRTVFWYSHDIGFFLREETSGVNSRGILLANTTLMLTSWK